MGRWTCLFAILMALIPLGEVYGESGITGYSQIGLWFDYSSDTGPVSHTDFYTSGYADAATQTLRAYASAEANAGEGKVSKMYPYFSNTLTVNPGTSGLSAGDLVILQLAISLDGDFSAGVGPVPHPSSVPSAYVPGYKVSHLGTVDAFASYKITDPNNLIDTGEGSITETLVEFG
ncbi:MAG TPA: hypothetical protein ENN18_04715 [Proteobacteria bacterium]|nr:hypothetical protein [Pseudomonadota bacterium]